MGLKELPHQRGSPPQSAVSLQASAAGWPSGKQCLGGKLPPAWWGASDSLCCLKRQGGELVVYMEKGLAMPVSAGTGTNPGAQEGGGRSGQLPVCRENGTLGPRRPQTGNWGQCPERPWSSVCRACILPASTSLLADDPTAHCTGSHGQARGATSCCAVRSSEGRESGFRVRWCRWLSQRRASRSVRWWPRSCPELGWARCSRRP